MKKLVKIKDVPYIYVYPQDIFSGELSEVANKVLGIRKLLEDAHAAREKSAPKNNFTPLEDYQKIRIETQSYHEEVDIEIVVEREETDEEYQKRLDSDKKKSDALKKAREDKAKANEKRERALLETLKKKYEK